MRCVCNIGDDDGAVVCSVVQLGEDKFRKIFAGQKVGLSDDNVSALISHYDRDHVGKVYYQDFIKDVRGCVSCVMLRFL